MSGSAYNLYDIESLKSKCTDETIKGCMDYVTQKAKASSEYYELFYMKNCAVCIIVIIKLPNFFNNSNQYAVVKKYPMATIAVVTWITNTAF